MKKVFNTFMVLIFSSLSLMGANKDSVAVELARAKKIDEMIIKVNSINEYVNQYILDYADKNIDKKKLINNYGVDSDLFLSDNQTDDISFSLQNNYVTYKGLFKRELTKNEIKFYKNSSKLLPTAIVNDDLSISVTLNPKALQLLSSLPTNGTISKDEPSDRSKPWYKPDGDGGYFTYIYKNNKWQLKTSGTNTKIVKTTTISNILSSKDELNNLVAKKGDKAYVRVSDKKVNRYIFDGNDWLLISTSSSSTSTSCSANELGVLRYSKEEDCIQSCQKIDKTYKFECIKDK